MANEIISNTNVNLATSVKGFFSANSLVNMGLWFFAFILFIGGGLVVWYSYYNKKQFNIVINDFEVIGNQYSFVRKDTAKLVKIGSGGFEILYLRKLKTYRLAFGTRMAKNTYYFFKSKDGYYYNSVLNAEINYINKLGGLIPIVTSNPAMRSQYTALETQINNLHENKESFWESNKTWIIPLIFILISGVMLWLIAKEVVSGINANASVTDKIGKLVDSVNNLIQNSQGAGKVQTIPSNIEKIS
jgi:hypothetical protein